MLSNTNLIYVPDNWELTKLSQLKTHDRPAIKAGPFGSSLKKSFYTKSGYKIYGQEQVIANNFSIGNYYIDSNRFETLKTCIVKPGDILVSLVGTFGKAIVVPDNIEPGIINPRLIRLSLAPDKVEPNFIKYWLESSIVQNLLSGIAHGGTMGVLNAKALKSLNILLPPLPEQKKIAAILSSVDRVIETTKDAIAQLQKIKRGLMQQLLTKGIPGWHKEYKNTAIGKIPDEWNLMTLEDVGTWKSGGTPSKKNQAYWNGSIPWVSAKDMKCDRLSKTIDYITDLGAANGTQVVSSGSILVVVRGMILAHSFPVTLTLKTVAFNQDIKALIPSEKFLSEFILYWLQYNKNNILALVSEATHGTKRLLQEELLSFPIPHSPLPEQKKIADILTSIDKRIEAEETNKTQVEKIKKGLMQQLLTGKIRVEV